MRITLRRENCNFNRVLRDTCGSTETATGGRDCSYGCATGKGTGLRAGVDVNLFYEIYRIYRFSCINIRISVCMCTR